MVMTVRQVGRWSVIVTPVLCNSQDTRLRTEGNQGLSPREQNTDVHFRSCFSIKCSIKPLTSKFTGILRVQLSVAILAVHRKNRDTPTSERSHCSRKAALARPKRLHSSTENRQQEKVAHHVNSFLLEDRK